MTKSIFNQISLESEITDGIARPEIEFVIYGKMTDTSLLQKSTKVIRQIQATRKGVVKGSQVRMRREQFLDPRTYKLIDKPVYTLTAKSPSKEHDGLDEVNSVGSEDLLKIFLNVAGEYLEKTRFVIPEDRIKQASCWEVDVFYDSNAEPIEWVKIDLEVKDSSLMELEFIPDLGLTDVIIVRAGVYKTASDSEFVAKLYSDYFTTKIA